MPKSKFSVISVSSVVYKKAFITFRVEHQGKKECFSYSGFCILTSEFLGMECFLYSSLHQ